MTKLNAAGSGKVAIEAMSQACEDVTNTCAASRHAALIAVHLIRQGVPQQLIDEPQHCGESIAHTVAELWRARTHIEKLRDLCVTVHDRLLRGDSDAELLAMLERGWGPPDNGFIGGKTK
jgi:hypothetical protein